MTNRYLLNKFSIFLLLLFLNLKIKSESPGEQEKYKEIYKEELEGIWIIDKLSKLDKNQFNGIHNSFYWETIQFNPPLIGEKIIIEKNKIYFQNSNISRNEKVFRECNFSNISKIRTMRFWKYLQTFNLDYLYSKVDLANHQFRFNFSDKLKVYNFPCNEQYIDGYDKVQAFNEIFYYYKENIYIITFVSRIYLEIKRVY